MTDTLEYKGYSAKIRFDAKGLVLRGVIDGIADYVDFESGEPARIEEEFHKAVDDYLSFCEKVGNMKNQGMEAAKGHV